MFNRVAKESNLGDCGKPGSIKTSFLTFVNRCGFELERCEVLFMASNYIHCNCCHHCCLMGLLMIK